VFLKNIKKTDYLGDQLKEATQKGAVKMRTQDSVLQGQEAMSMGNQFLTSCGNVESMCSSLTDATACSPQFVAEY
jgi:hypothetical protein